MYVVYALIALFILVIKPELALMIFIIAGILGVFLYLLFDGHDSAYKKMNQRAEEASRQAQREKEEKASFLIAMISQRVSEQPLWGSRDFPL